MDIIKNFLNDDINSINYKNKYISLYIKSDLYINSIKNFNIINKTPNKKSQEIIKYDIIEKIIDNVLDKNINKKEYYNININNELVLNGKLLPIDTNVKNRYKQCYTPFNENSNINIKHIGGINTIENDIKKLLLNNVKINLENEMKLFEKNIVNSIIIYNILKDIKIEIGI